MNAALTILRGPLDVGVLYPHIWLAAVLLLLKLFDAWSTHHILKRGGRETMSLAAWCVKRFGVKVGLAVDFALVAAAAWFCYPFEPLLVGVVTWYAYWMAIQVGELRKIYKRQQQ